MRWTIAVKNSIKIAALSERDENHPSMEGPQGFCSICVPHVLPMWCQAGFGGTACRDLLHAGDKAAVNFFSPETGSADTRGVVGLV